MLLVAGNKINKVLLNLLNRGCLCDKHSGNDITLPLVHGSLQACTVVGAFIERMNEWVQGELCSAKELTLVSDFIMSSFIPFLIANISESK